MINLINKSKCCGCNSCVQKCPKKCISMQEDEEGFLYPHIDTDICIDCHVCEKVCPVINKNEPRTPLACYAAKNPDENIRMKSSSGGIFSMLAEKVINDGGVVFGAGFNRKWQVVHSYTETKEGIAAFRGSKYVQSVIGNTYKETEFFLKQGREVLFSGTPCQIAGLKKYLCKEYENLITVDFICHGVPSPGVFRWYLQEVLNNHAARKVKKDSIMFPTTTSIPKGDIQMPEGISITDIRFRDKREGWKKYCFTLQIAEDPSNDKDRTVTYSSNLHKNLYLKGFLKDLYLRPSCYDCPSKCLSSQSDITIADFWGINRINNSLDDNGGISAILANSAKGKKLLENIDLNLYEVSFNDILKNNSAINHSSRVPSNRKRFWSYKGSLHERIQIFAKTPLLLKLIHFVNYRILKKISNKLRK